MPTKPTQEVINASKKKINPKDVVRAIINETPILRENALKAGVVFETED